MELHEYMESRGITRDSITAEQERTRDRIEPIACSDSQAKRSNTGVGRPIDGRFSKTRIRARAWGIGFDEA